jgi:hypothetical protein
VAQPVPTPNAVGNRKLFIRFLVFGILTLSKVPIVKCQRPYSKARRQSASIQQLLQGGGELQSAQTYNACTDTATIIAALTLEGNKDTVH